MFLLHLNFKVLTPKALLNSDLWDSRNVFLSNADIQSDTRISAGLLVSAERSDLNQNCCFCEQIQIHLQTLYTKEKSNQARLIMLYTLRTTCYIFLKCIIVLVSFPSVRTALPKTGCLSRENVGEG